jgi:two-component system KDP operon response regulator KdpE
VSEPVTAAAETPDTRPTVVVIDDEANIRAVICQALDADVARCIEASTGEAGLDRIAAERPDLVILDLGLPGVDGLEVCRRLRSRSSVPIVVLSARHSEDEKAMLLDAGADDYVTKPFSPVELRARVRAQLRRARMAPVPGGDRPLTVADLTIDPARHTVTRGETTVHLTPTEWDLLIALVTNRGRTMTHQQLFHHVWGKSYGDAQQYLRVYVTHLRKKLEPDVYRPRYIVTEPGVGYRFEAAE